MSRFRDRRTKLTTDKNKAGRRTTIIAAFSKHYEIMKKISHVFRHEHISTTT